MYIINYIHMKQRTINKANFEILVPSLKRALKNLKWPEKRKFLAQIAMDVWRWWISLVVKTFNAWHDTVDKWIKELKSWFTCIDATNVRHVVPIEKRLPNFLWDIKDVIEWSSHIDPKFKSTRLYTRLTQIELRKQLIIQKWYKDEDLPTPRTIYTKAISMWYKFNKVSKTKPLKKNTWDWWDIWEDSGSK